MVESVAMWILPGVLLLAGILLLRLGKRGSDAFLRGARNGLSATVSLLPAMVMLTVGLTMFTASGAVEWMTEALTPVCGTLGIPAGILPLFLTRPVSGAASTATFAELLSLHGADSRTGLSASVLMGASDTLIYVISVYFSGAKGVRGTRHAFPVAMIIMILCVLLSCFLCNAML